jgi:hypothetical protein
MSFETGTMVPWITFHNQTGNITYYNTKTRKWLIAWRGIPNMDEGFNPGITVYLSHILPVFPENDIWIDWFQP